MDDQTGRGRRLARRLPQAVALTVLAGALVAPSAALAAPLATSADARVAAVTPAATGCVDVLTIGARGSGEDPQPGQSYSKAHDLGYGSTIWTAKGTAEAGSAGLVTRRAVPVVYPSLSVDYLTKVRANYLSRVRTWVAGLKTGVTFTLSLLSSAATACPAERFVLMGYSQGAMLMHQVLARLATNADMLNRIAFVVLVADPDRAPKQGTQRAGTATDAVSGIDSWARGAVHAKPIAFPAGIRARVVSICNADDLVCDFNTRPCRGRR